jgi:BMFP domain-containing protein YqiC
MITEEWAREFMEGFSRDLQRTCDRVCDRIVARYKVMLREQIKAAQELSETRLAAVEDRIAALEASSSEGRAS